MHADSDRPACFKILFNVSEVVVIIGVSSVSAKYFLGRSQCWMWDLEIKLIISARCCADGFAKEHLLVDFSSSYVRSALLLLLSHFAEEEIRAWRNKEPA